MRQVWNRREVLRALGSTGIGAVAVWARAVRAATPPAARPRVIAIGVRSRGAAIAVGAAAHAQVVAVCDVDRSMIDSFLGRLAKVQTERPRTYTDYREALAQEQADAVTIGTPDHWHARMVADAVRAGLDVYVEKPLTLTIAEGDALVRRVRESDRVVAVGTQQRTEYDGIFLKAAAAVRLGWLGHPVRANIFLPSHYGNKLGPFPTREPPQELDWDLWRGPSWAAPYCPERCHGSWRNWLETGNGPATDWGVHHVDIVLWSCPDAARTEWRIEGEADFPLGREVTCEVLAQRQSFDTLPNKFNVPRNYRATIRIGDLMHIEIHGCAPQAGQASRNGIELAGPEGRIWVSRSGSHHEFQSDRVAQLERSPADRRALLDEMDRMCRGRLPVAGGPVGQIGDIIPTSHMADFIRCIRERATPIADVESHHLANTMCLLALISMTVARPLKWLPLEHRFGEDCGDAALLLKRHGRAPFALADS